MFFALHNAIFAKVHDKQLVRSLAVFPLAHFCPDDSRVFRPPLLQYHPVPLLASFFLANLTLAVSLHPSTCLFFSLSVCSLYVFSYFIHLPQPLCLSFFLTPGRRCAPGVCSDFWPREGFSRCLRGMRLPLSVREGNRLYSALLPATTDAGGARYSDIIDFLRRNNEKWYEVERDIAEKVRARTTKMFERREWPKQMRSLPCSSFVSRGGNENTTGHGAKADGTG